MVLLPLKWTWATNLTKNILEAFALPFGVWYHHVHIFVVVVVAAAAAAAVDGVLVVVGGMIVVVLGLADAVSVVAVGL